MYISVAQFWDKTTRYIDGLSLPKLSFQVGVGGGGGGGGGFIYRHEFVWSSNENRYIVIYFES